MSFGRALFLLISEVAIVLVLLLVFTPEGHSEPSSLSRATFGEACNKSIRCDSRSSLSCNTDEICQCIKPDEMTFDEGSGSCKVVSGERCSYTAIEITDTAQEKRWTETLECVSNAHCSPEGYCECGSTYFESFEGLCMPKRPYGYACTKGLECRGDQNLVCVENKCVCNATEAVFDATHEKCVGRSGYSCKKYDTCVRNANCPTKSQYFYQYANTDLCRCSSDHTQSENGLCLAKYSMSCNVDSAPCSENWSCIDTMCNCPFPNHQLYNVAKLECMSYVNGPCLETLSGGKVKTFECVANAECQNEGGIHECKCKHGYIESNYRQCSLAYGQECDERTYEQCDKVANLICNNGKCDCSDFEKYDINLTKCRGMIGAKCSVTDESFCVDGASCKSFRETISKLGTCRCVPPYVPDSNRGCQKVASEAIRNWEDVENGTASESVEVISVTEAEST